MNSQLTGLDILFEARLLDEPFGQGGLFPMSDHPADDVPTEDVHDHVEVKVGPLDRAFQFGDIPGPDLIGTSSEQFWLLVLRVRQLISPFSAALVLFEKSIHRPHATEITALIK